MKAMAIVSRAVSSRSTLPVLKGVLITAYEEGKIELSASDNDISISTTLEAVVMEEGKVVVPAKLMGEIVRKLPQGDVFFKEEMCLAEISCSYTEYKIVCIPPDEFPEIKEVSEEEGFLLDKAMFGEMIKRVGFAASIDETRGIITGVLTEIRDGEIIMAALDGFRMAVMKKGAEGAKEGKIVIHGRTMNEIGKIMAEIETSARGEEKEVIKITLAEKKAFFRTKSTLIIARLMDGAYINYRDVIPKEFSVTVVANTEEIKEIVERASIILHEGKNAYIIVDIKEDVFHVSSKSEEGFASDETKVIKKGSDIKIGFNGKLLMEVLKAIPDEEVKMNFGTPTSACVITPVEGDAYVYMALPIRLPAGS
jgi:DNA polymerase-3 subunit beta